jgi:DNA polymerase-3 subunit epsilon
VTREPRAGAAHLGPFRSAAAAHAVRDAIETAAPLRRCTRRVGRNAALACEPCVPAQLGVASCPCSGQTPAAEYADVVDAVRRAFAGDARGLLTPLEERMRRLADGERFEEAALARDRLRALSSAIARQRLADATRAVRRLVVTTPATTVVLVHGRAQLGDHSTHEARDTRDERDALFPDLSLPPRRDEIDELLLTARWLRRAGGQRRASLVETAGTWASPLPPLPVYEVRRPDVRSTR